MSFVRCAGSNLPISLQWSSMTFSNRTPRSGIVSARANGDQEGFGICGKLAGERAVMRGVFAGAHRAAAPPGLVADAPVAHTEGLAVAICAALVGQARGSRGSVAIRHPIV